MVHAAGGFGDHRQEIGIDETTLPGGYAAAQGGVAGSEKTARSRVKLLGFYIYVESFRRFYDAALDQFQLILFVFRRVIFLMDITPRGANVFFVIDRIFVIYRVGEFSVAIFLLASVPIYVFAFVYRFLCHISSDSVRFA